jgi:hypothetical protein
MAGFQNFRNKFVRDILAICYKIIRFLSQAGKVTNFAKGQKFEPDNNGPGTARRELHSCLGREQTNQTENPRKTIHTKQNGEHQTFRPSLEAPPGASAREYDAHTTSENSHLLGLALIDDERCC